MHDCLGNVASVDWHRHQIGEEGTNGLPLQNDMYMPISTSLLTLRFSVTRSWSETVRLFAVVHWITASVPRKQSQRHPLLVARLVSTVHTYVYARTHIPVLAVLRALMRLNSYAFVPCELDSSVQSMYATHGRMRLLDLVISENVVCLLPKTLQVGLPLSLIHI